MHGCRSCRLPLLYVVYHYNIEVSMVTPDDVLTLRPLTLCHRDLGADRYNGKLGLLSPSRDHGVIKQEKNTAP